MKYVIVAFFLLISLTSIGQKVYIVRYPYQADIKVWVADYPSLADKVVQIVKHPYEVREGRWYYVQYSYLADIKVYFVKYSYQADLKIFFKR